MEEFNLKQIFNIFWKRRIGILIILILTISLGTAYSFLTVKPAYQSYTTILLTPVNNKITSEGIEYIGNLTKEELSLNSKLISSYNELLKSKEILKEIAEELNIEGINESNLQSSISLSAINDTGMIKITAISANAKHAEKIANKTAEVFCEKIANTFIENNVKIINKAEVSAQPFNINHKRDIIVSVFIAIVIICGYVLVRYLWESSKESK